jgi:hypothetical protein
MKPSEQIENVVDDITVAPTKSPPPSIFYHRLQRTAAADVDWGLLRSHLTLIDCNVSHDYGSFLV